MPHIYLFYGKGISTVPFPIEETTNFLIFFLFKKPLTVYEKIQFSRQVLARVSKVFPELYKSACT